MRLINLLLVAIVFIFCKVERPIVENEKSIQAIRVQIDTFPMDCSIRAIEVVDKNIMWFGGSKGQFGYTENGGKTWIVDSIKIEKQPNLEFRGIAKTETAIFLLAIGAPALLFKSTDKGKNWTTVYQENHKNAFYDAIAFWDTQNGIAMGDPTDGCLSVILTKDGGNTWSKIPCSNLPPTVDGEAAFAASNSNISIFENHAWLVSGGKKARVFHSEDYGQHWEVYDTPIIQGGMMTGIFTSHFYDEQNGIIFGGNWEEQTHNQNNKAITQDGGQTWQVVANGQYPGYRSSVRYIPNSKGPELWAVGIPGISYSKNGGQTWQNISSDSFYTIRVCKNNQSAWLAGRNKVAKMVW